MGKGSYKTSNSTKHCDGYVCMYGTIFKITRYKT